MSKIIFATILLLVTQVALAATKTVAMKSLSYEPKILKLKVGDSAQWVNHAYTEHSATSDNTVAGFDTGLVQPNKTSKSIAFDKPGTFTYHCVVHGKTMSGQIVVTP